ncbi:sodium:solute symporter family protein [Desulfovibrio sp. OttesenSCG-928-G15]|nr:sodium:solute symporter family protein [Desulfovibrio sp. OttesenSCG-928-G15]
MSPALENMGIAAVWVGYIGLFLYLARKGKGHDAALSGRVGFVVQSFAYVATYISAVALVGFGGLAHAYGLQMLLVAAGNVWLGTWAVYRFLAWPTKRWQERLKARSPATLIGKGHYSPLLSRVLALVFAIFLGVYASAVIKGAALLLVQIVPIPEWALVWLIALTVGGAVAVGGLRGVLYTEAMQGIIMLLGISMIVAAVLVKVGGPIDGIIALAALPPDSMATNGFTALSGGSQGLFIISLVTVTSVAVWAQPQMVQRHFAVRSRAQLARITPLAMLVLTVLVGGAYFAASLSKLFIPEVPNPDALMPYMASILLPGLGTHVFILAVVSASLSTATSLFHIASLALSEDVPAKQSTSRSWACGIVLCVLISAGCAQAEGRLIAMLCTTSWSMVGATVLVPYVALVRFGWRNTRAAWASAVAGFAACLFWYTCVYAPTAFIDPVLPGLSALPPFFAGFAASLCGWATQQSSTIATPASTRRAKIRKVRKAPKSTGHPI